jgi:hypothetical protein
MRRARQGQRPPEARPCGGTRSTTPGPSRATGAVTPGSRPRTWPLLSTSGTAASRHTYPPVYWPVVAVLQGREGDQLEPAGAARPRWEQRHQRHEWQQRYARHAGHQRHERHQRRHQRDGQQGERRSPRDGREHIRGYRLRRGAARHRRWLQQRRHGGSRHGELTKQRRRRKPIHNRPNAERLAHHRPQFSRHHRQHRSHLRVAVGS